MEEFLSYLFKRNLCFDFIIYNINTAVLLENKYLVIVFHFRNGIFSTIYLQNVFQYPILKCSCRTVQNSDRFCGKEVHNLQ